MGGASKVTTAFVLAGLLYSLLFVSHIVAAANGWVLAHKIGFSTSLFLSVGLAYAYAGQTFDAPLSLGFLGITGVVHSITFRLLNSSSEQKVD